MCFDAKRPTGIVHASTSQVRGVYRIHDSLPGALSSTLDTSLAKARIDKALFHNLVRRVELGPLVLLPSNITLSQGLGRIAVFVDGGPRRIESKR